jgi:hypothetical protein
MLELLVLLATLGLPDPGDGAAPRALCRIVLDPGAYGPGDVTLALATCDAPPVRFQARLDVTEIAFFPLSPALRETGDEAPTVVLGALLGIDVAAERGSPRLTWEAKFGGGEFAHGMNLLTVAPRTFPVQRLRLERRFVEPDSAARARIEAEARRMARVLKRSAGERLWRGAFLAPLPGAAGGGFGARRVLNGLPATPHTGLDLRAPAGTAVFAPNSAVAVFVDTLFYGGKTVVLDHGLGLFTVYSHLSQVSVLEGDPVHRGQLIGRVGATGRVTGPHLHWAADLNGARVDPLSLMAATRGSARLEPSPLRLPDRMTE